MKLYDSTPDLARQFYTQELLAAAQSVHPHIDPASIVALSTLERDINPAGAQILIAAREVFIPRDDLITEYVFASTIDFEGFSSSLVRRNTAALPLLYLEAYDNSPINLHLSAVELSPALQGRGLGTQAQATLNYLAREAGYQVITAYRGPESFASALRHGNWLVDTLNDTARNDFPELFANYDSTYPTGSTYTIQFLNAGDEQRYVLPSVLQNPSLKNQMSYMRKILDDKD